MLVSYSITSSTVTADHGLYPFIVSYMLGYGMISWAIACGVVSCVTYYNCYASLLHFKILVR